MLNFAFPSDILNSSESTFIEVDLVTNELISDLIISFICFIGIMSNAVAMFILSSTSSIRKSRPYVLLVNQCLMDLLALVSSEISKIAKYALKREGMRGFVDQLLCNLVHNDLGVAVHICASSYNLAALSGERMFSVVWPILHRISFTPKNLKRTAVVIWIFSLIAILSHSIGTNGISPNGRCYYWVAKVGIHADIFIITFNIIFSIIPFIIMLVCYTSMYTRIIGSHLKVKMNVIHVLGTCLVLFVLCHAPRIIYTAWSWYGNVSWKSKTTLNITFAFLVSNTFVNPIVYIIQFKDYNLEFRRQVHRIFSHKMATVVPKSSSLSVVSS